MNTNIEYIHDFLENVKDDSSLFERILDDIHDSERLNNGDDKHKVYYLQLTGDDNSGEKDFWVANVRHYFHLYVYAMLFNWKERWADDEIIKSRIETLQNNFSSEIASEIKKFNEKVTENVPPIVLSEIKFISDAFLWRCTKEVPHFTEGQIKEIDKYHSNYGRYITLINSDKQEDIAKDIDKYLSYCMAIDEVYENTDCLTSFIIHLSGTGDNTVNFDTILKSIPAESWGINTIRQSLIKGEQNIPADIIKLAIYSQNVFCENGNLSEINDEQQKEFVRDFFCRASEDFDILSNNKSRLDVVDQLKLASYIRDNLITNEIASLACNKDASINSSRQEILDKIMDFQDGIISTIKSDVSSTAYSGKDIQDFSLAKQELVELLTSEIQSIKGYMNSNPEEAKLCKDLQKHLESCEIIISRCNDEKYTILLLGEYQSGKTTTFNTFCEGRNVGAIGDGSKTSAIPLAISYADKNDVSLIWKKKEEVVDTLLHIQKYLRIIDLKKIDIDDPQIRISIQEKIEDVRGCGCELKNIPRGDLQFLALSSIIMEFWNSDSLKQFQKEKPSFNEIRYLTRFPKKMVDRWWKHGVSSFIKIEEVAFIFIKQIECQCSSELLKTMNAIVLDCPGLFASDYDTQVTVNSMKDANAILYIFPREKESGSQIDESLGRIKRRYPDFHKKLFFANNLTFKSRNSKSIFEANRQNVKQLFGDGADIVPYDAQIAYLGHIKKTYDKGLLDSESEQAFINEHTQIDFFGKETKYTDFGEAWSSLCGSIGSADMAIKYSKFSELTNALVSFVEKNKANSIIVSDGIAKLKSELEGLLNHLYITYIEPYQKDKDELENQWNERISSSIIFEELASSKINEILLLTSTNEQSVEQRLSDAIYDRLFSSDIYNALNEKICDELYDNAKTLKKLKNDKEEFEKFTTNLVSECINNMIHDRISYCNRLLSSNQDMDFQNIFITALNAFENNMDIIWSEKVFGKDATFKGLRSNYYPIKKDTSAFSMTEQKRETNLPVDEKKISSAAVMKNVIGVGGAAIGIGGYGIFFYACAVSGPIGWIIGGLAVMFSGLWFWGETDEYNKKNFRKKMMPGLEQQLNKSGIKDYIKSIISDNINRILNDYILGLGVDKEKLARDKDASMSIINNPNLESDCFYAVNAYKRIEKQILSYDDYYNKL